MFELPVGWGSTKTVAVNEVNEERNQELHEERRKRVKLCELFLLVLGVDPAAITSPDGFLDQVVRNVAQDLDVLSAALAQGAAEDHRTPDVVETMADGLRYGQLGDRQVRELLGEFQLSGGVRGPEQP